MLKDMSEYLLAGLKAVIKKTANQLGQRCVDGYSSLVIILPGLESLLQDRTPSNKLIQFEPTAHEN